MSLILSGDGSVGPLSSTEMGYLDGVTSAVQTQLNSAQTQINTKAATTSQGLVFLGLFTANAAARLDMTNLFTSYSRLRLVIYAATSVGGWISMRFLNGSTPDASAAYRYAGARLNFNGTPSQTNVGGFGATSVANFIYNENEVIAFMDLQGSYGIWSAVSNGGNTQWGATYSEGLGVINGLTLYPAGAGTINGWIRVYGYGQG